MILNTGNRTDIPAFYSKWFYRRIRDGYVLARNPYNPQQVTRYLLDPEVVDCIAFCTKNPAPMLSQMELLKDFRQFWSVTITPYGRDIEPYVPSSETVIESFRRLSDLVGVNCVSWRYDPVFISEKYTVDFHLQAFEKIAEALKGYTEQCVISFIDLYDKTKRNFPEARTVRKEERMALGKAFIDIAARCGMRLTPCGEGDELEPAGADCRGCQSAKVLEQAIGFPIDPPASSKTREGCSCILGSDIGAYNTCGHGCLYCYANYDRETVEYNMKEHDPFSPFLIGDFMDGDIIKSAEQESWIRWQLSIDDLLGKQ